MTSPAVVYKDLVIVGGAMSETLPASPGDIRAYDAHSGQVAVVFSYHSSPWRIRLQNMAEDSVDL